MFTILDLDNRWRWMVSFTLWLIYTPDTQCIGRVVGPRASLMLWRWEKSLVLGRNWILVGQSLARSTPTKPPQLQYVALCNAAIHSKFKGLSEEYSKGHQLYYMSKFFQLIYRTDISDDDIWMSKHDGSPIKLKYTMNNTLCYNLAVLWQVFIFRNTLVVMREEENSECHHKNVWHHSNMAPWICTSLITSSESSHATCLSHRNSHSDYKTNCRLLCFTDLSDSSKDVRSIQKFEDIQSHTRLEECAHLLICDRWKF